MADLDLAAKVILREDPLAMIRLACPGLQVRSARLAPTEQVRLHQLQDCLVGAELEDAGEVWFHFEALAGWKADVPGRTFRYWCLAWIDHHPLLSVVLCMKPGGAPEDRLEVRFGDLEVVRFGFVLVRLWELSQESLLATPSLAPLAVFAAGASEATAERAMATLQAIEPRERRVELQVALALLAGNVFPTRSWLAMIPKEILMESTTYQQILAEGETRGEARGRLIGERSLLWLLLEERLPAEAARFRERLERCSEEELERAARLVARLTEPGALASALDALLPPAGPETRV